jgi:lipopolysaccharide biosynthesis glycosyltransferase
MNTIHICIAADRNYKLPLMCLLESVYKNNRSKPCIVHVLYDNLSGYYRNKLVKKYKGTNISLEFMNMSGLKFDFHGLDMQHWTKAIFYRIMIPEIFTNLNRILYIDCDTLVLDDLFNLFNTDIPSDKNIAMVVDKYSWKTHMIKLNIKNYFNSGMILFNLQKCRKDKFTEKCIKWLYANTDKAVFPDQDAINTVCDGKIVRISNLYNKQFAPNERIACDKHPVIIHFLSAVKPWMAKAPVSYSKLYRQYIPCKIQKYIILATQLIWQSKDFCFHKKHSMTLQHAKIVEQNKYYLFNICVFTKKLNKQQMNITNIITKKNEQ